jgi:membrane-bound lytic murein transglycosylase B
MHRDDNIGCGYTLVVLPEFDDVRRVAVIVTAILAAAMATAAPLALGAEAKAKAKAGKAAKAEPTGYAQRADVKAFIAEMVTEHGFDRAALTRVFSAAHYQPKIVAAMQRPLLEPPKWYEYAPRFLTPARIDGGVAYWNAHIEELTRAEAQFGVPAEVIVAIIGVETSYGRNTGSYRAIDALSTLAFDYPRRAEFFRGELKHFLLLTREQKISPLVPKGSFAGALGVPQFMPGSYRNFAIDFDADGRVDLWLDGPDIVGSVANFLVRHDWQRGQPVLLRATLAPEQSDVVMRRLDGGLSERRALDEWKRDGVVVGETPADLAAVPVGVLLLEEPPGAAGSATYWIACHNFYVITRYNRSRLYATAVWQLAQAIRGARAGSS